MRSSILSPCLVAAALVAAAAVHPAVAAVSVITGPTPIPLGAARAAGDITVVNEKLAFAIAVQSVVPYGVPRGALVDLAPVSNGTIQRDRVVYADFIPNDWSAWPNTYQQVDILERGPDRAVIRSVRDWGAVTITTTYTLEAGADHIVLSTTMRNGGAQTLANLLSGFTLWPNSGYRFGVPGLSSLEHGPATGALADRTVAYDADWMIALHAPYLTDLAHASLDLYQRHDLAPGASRSFDAWLQVGASGDLAPVVAAEILRQRLPAGLVRGSVAGRDGRAIGQPVVVVEKAGQPYAWVLGANGRYSIRLPAGNYTLYATARSHSQSAAVALAVAAGSEQTRDFVGLDAPGHLRFDVRGAADGQPLDARIAISRGQQPLVEFLGRRTFFTELEPRGRLDLDIAPGAYAFEVSSGGGFTTPASTVALRVEPGKTRRVRVALRRRFDPARLGWYAADLHHHADQAEAVTPPADLARSQLAAGLDLLFVSDHDSLVNLPPLQRIAEQRGIAFIPGIELSPSWGHFNAYPIDAGKSLAIDPGTATVDALFAEARRLGASVVQVNHPLISYGYFTSLAAGQAPGGFNPAFDLVEINATESATDRAVFERMWQFWNEGQRYYLAGGTDTHDVWNLRSGRLRTYAHPAGALTTASYVAALRAGHAYVSYGPLIYPDVCFGDTLTVPAGREFHLGFALESLPGVKSVDLIGNGEDVARRDYGRGPGNGPQRTRADFRLRADRAGWYALVVEDTQGHRAYTDPVWVELAPAR
ncbi:MAG: CehA/McbA family metallohydrolase [Gammaproteobacteria bacterium]|nr:CehA/McbA family metallohydrolase [Gammaproteobacteria bacterium]